MWPLDVVVWVKDNVGPGVRQLTGVREVGVKVVIVVIGGLLEEKTVVPLDVRVCTCGDIGLDEFDIAIVAAAFNNVDAPRVGGAIEDVVVEVRGLVAVMTGVACVPASTISSSSISGCSDAVVVDLVSLSRC